MTVNMHGDTYEDVTKCLPSGFSSNLDACKNDHVNAIYSRRN
jgi:hypothetical protein